MSLFLITTFPSSVRRKSEYFKSVDIPSLPTIQNGCEMSACIAAKASRRIVEPKWLDAMASTPGTAILLNWRSFFVAVSSSCAVSSPKDPRSKSSGARFGMFDFSAHAFRQRGRLHRELLRLFSEA